MQARLAGAEAAVVRYQDLADAADNNNNASNNDAESSLRTHARGLARSVVALEVAVPVLTRRHNLLKAELAAARTAARTAEVRGEGAPW